MLRPGTVHLWEVRHRCHVKWRLRPYTSAAWTAYVSVGTLGTGEWYVHVVEILYHPAAIVGSEEEARARAAQWMEKLASHPERAGGSWEQVPCYATFGWQPGERSDQAGSSEQT